MRRRFSLEIRRAAAVWIAATIVSACQAGGAPGGAPGGASGGPASRVPASEAAASDPAGTRVVASGKVDVGGHSLSYACYGEGSPTVILDHGLGGDSGEWQDVVPAVSGRTRVCGYDRANVRGSDAVEGPRTVADAAADLHALLGKIGVTGPSVFVGFSWGGLVDQLYARTYPDDVGGLVLVDSNHPDEDRTYWAHLTPAQIALDKEEMATANPENVDIVRSFDLVRAAPKMPDVPLVVVTHTVPDPYEWPTGWDPATFEKLQAGLQEDLVTLTTKGRQVLAEGAGHDIPNENPGAVSDAILAVLDAMAAP
jgi:pimeloyl-ACP methyl ester carboxylesterase